MKKRELHPAIQKVIAMLTESLADIEVQLQGDDKTPEDIAALKAIGEQARHTVALLRGNKVSTEWKIRFCRQFAGVSF